MAEQKRFSGKVAIVTGGCRGIGKSIVEHFATEGAKVFAFDYVIPEADSVFIEDNNLSTNVSCIQCDVTKESSVNSAFEIVIKEAGRIDFLVNNAGITRDNIVLRLSEADWDAVLQTNLKGAFLCSKVACKQMMSQRSGRIVNMGSVVGSSGNAGQANYSASKAGLIGLTKSLAKELGSRNILVNLIAPGFVQTPMTDKLTEEQKNVFLTTIPLKRAANPADIAKVTAFLCSDDSSYITGQVIHVDGGLYM
jgi:3-oxoacyl-[acyl-carrier protein] reductase